MCVREFFPTARLLTEMAGHDYMALELLQPLGVTRAQVDRVVAGLDSLFHALEHEKTRFWSQGVAIGARLVGLAS